ncbi:MAG: hypothetical protein Ct9H90mP20_3670 [Candidatus Neomarinimicrobiota bacterium]|nr:MAG: hypothetical protein Ct9H90mP20_3670 [Candidatus Neomarinimicrobiota bacterium]
MVNAYSFVGWGIYFIYTLIRFRLAKQPKADYHGVKNHYSTYSEVAVALIEVVLLIGFSFPIWASRVNDVPNTLDSIQIGLLHSSLHGIYITQDQIIFLVQLALI